MPRPHEEQFDSLEAREERLAALRAAGKVAHRGTVDRLQADGSYKLVYLLFVETEC